MVRKLSMIATERVKSGEWLPPWTVAEHEARYAFASRFVRGLAVVDCASGNGNGAAVFLRSEPASLVGFDVDQEAVDAANTTLGTDLASFRRAEATALPAGDATADVFISLETVEHVEDDRGFLGEVARVLKPDGLFICSTPNRSVTNPGTGLADRPWNPFHVREYTPLEYLDLLTERFEVVGWYGQNRTAGRQGAMAGVDRRYLRPDGGGANQPGLEVPLVSCGRGRGPPSDRIGPGSPRRIYGGRLPPQGQAAGTTTTSPRISVVIPVSNAPADVEDTFRAVVTGTEIEYWFRLMSLSDGFDARPVGSYGRLLRSALTGSLPRRRRRDWPA